MLQYLGCGRKQALRDLDVRGVNDLLARVSHRVRHAALGLEQRGLFKADLHLTGRMRTRQINSISGRYCYQTIINDKVNARVALDE